MALSFFNYVDARKVPLALSALVGIGVTIQGMSEIRQTDHWKSNNFSTTLLVLEVAAVVASIATTCFCAANLYPRLTPLNILSVAGTVVMMRVNLLESPGDPSKVIPSDYAAAVKQIFVGLALTAALPFLGMGITYARFLKIQK